MKNKTVDKKTVKDFMHKNKAVASRNQRVWSAFRQMKKENCELMVVIDGEAVLGTISQRDIQLVASLSGNEQTDVFEVMDNYFAEIDEAAPIEVAIEKLLHEKKPYLLVTKENKPVGFFSSYDAINFYKNLMQNAFTPKGALRTL